MSVSKLNECLKEVVVVFIYFLKIKVKFEYNVCNVYI